VLSYELILLCEQLIIRGETFTPHRTRADASPCWCTRNKRKSVWIYLFQVPPNRPSTRSALSSGNRRRSLPTLGYPLQRKYRAIPFILNLHAPSRGECLLVFAVVSSRSGLRRRIAARLKWPGAQQILPSYRSYALLTDNDTLAEGVAGSSPDGSSRQLQRLKSCNARSAWMTSIAHSFTTPPARNPLHRRQVREHVWYRLVK
jgi:hypothetical protein